MSRVTRLLWGAIGLVGVGCGAGEGLTPDEGGGAESDASDSSDSGGGSECEAGARRCDGNELVECKASGVGETLVEACDDGFVCSEADGGGCMELLCEPDALSCAENEVVRCSADGRSLEPQQDCGDEVCSEGTCVEPVCDDSQRRCQQGVVQACSSDRLTWEEEEVCGAGTYCAGETATCEEQICVPDAVACDAHNRLETCNGDGSALISQQACGRGNYCYGTQCNAQWRYDFDTKSIAGWVTNSRYTNSFVTGTNATPWALAMTTSGSGYPYLEDGQYLDYPLPEYQVSALQFSFKVNRTDRDGGCLKLDGLQDGERVRITEVCQYGDPVTPAIWVRFGKLNDQGFYTNAMSSTVIHEANVWYDVRIVFNWDQQYFDLHIDGVQVKNNIAFLNNATSAVNLGLGVLGKDTQVTFDQILFE
ncbi:MAG TPA: hypothetical protein VLC09_18065 [Polyangiaceae bacterium]|nr:hypothetical protein [Polyangiaceae bacterium]